MKQVAIFFVGWPGNMQFYARFSFVVIVQDVAILREQDEECPRLNLAWQM